MLTSNLGADVLLNADALHPDAFEILSSTKEVVMGIVGQYFSPELINCIEESIFFLRLFKPALRDTGDIRLKELQARLYDRRIVLQANEDVKDLLTEKAYDPRTRVTGQGL